MKLRNSKSIYRQKNLIFYYYFQIFLLFYYYFLIFYYFIILLFYYYFSGSLNLRHVAWCAKKTARWICDTWHGVLTPKITKIPFVAGTPKITKIPFSPNFTVLLQIISRIYLETLFRCRDGQNYENTLRCRDAQNYQNTLFAKFHQISQFCSKSPPECPETLFIYKITQNTSKYSQNSRNYTKY